MDIMKAATLPDRPDFSLMKLNDVISYTEYDCNPGDRVIVHITRYDYTKKHIYGRIVARW